MNLKDISYRRASIENVDAILNIIVRCMKEVNYKDYIDKQFNKYLSMFTREWITNIIETRHYYEAWYDGKILASGGVSRDYSKDKQSYFTAIFVNPDFHGLGVGKDLILFLEQDKWCIDSNLIEIPSSKSSHGFYYKLGYKYRTNPPAFNEDDGSTIMYKYKKEV